MAEGRTGRPPKPLVERLWSYIDLPDDPDGCWLWTGPKGKKGYGILKVAGHNLVAARLVYEMEVGPIPPLPNGKPQPLDHFVCDNGPGGCVSPLHVRPASHRENLLRGDTIPARNLAKRECLNGHPFDEANTYWRPDRPGVRDCRTCRAERDRAGRVVI